jgi:general secretion pathway protein C
MNGIKSSMKKNLAPFGNKGLPYLVFVLMGFTVADTLIIAYRDLMLPTQAPPSIPPGFSASNMLDSGSLQTVLRRNIFHSEGGDPPALQPKGVVAPPEVQQAPVLSSLPLNLIGTLVHSNPAKSIAAIELKSKNQILSYTENREIDTLATVEKIERGKVFIRNTNNGRHEYIELKSNSKVAFGAPPKISSTGIKAEIKQVSENQFEISRADLNKYTSDLSSILMQARAVPAKRPGTGETYGFRLLEIQPGSVYTQLGLRPMDVICGVNGSPVTNPQQAMELYSALKSSSGIELCIERDGKTNSFKYTIPQ